MAGEGRRRGELHGPASVASASEQELGAEAARSQGTPFGLNGWHRGGADGEQSIVEQHERRTAPTWVAVTTGSDWCLRALHREHGHCTVARSVVSGTGAMTGARC
jgi:hypothetical protein